MLNLDNLRPQDQRALTLSNGNPGAIIRISADGNCLFRAAIESYKHSGKPVPAYMNDHLSLRARVVTELEKQNYLQVINATLSDETGTQVENITEQDREHYLNKMKKPSFWGGTPEAYAIAELLQIRIVIHENGNIMKIPHGTEHDAREELIELVHEPVNLGLSDEIPPDKQSDNHYNLVIPTALAQQIITGHHSEMIQAYKIGIQKCPRLDSKEEIVNFKSFFLSLHEFYQTMQEGSPNQKLKDKYYYNLEMLWKFFLDKFMEPYWYVGEHGLDQELRDKYLSGHINTKKVKILIKKASEENELRRFFEAYPYVKDLLKLDEYLSAQIPSFELEEIFYNTVNNYLSVLKFNNQIRPLFVLREHVKLMLSRTDFDLAFYKKYMKGAEANLKDRAFKPESDLIFLSLFVGSEISYDLRKSSGFKKINWDAFDGLYRSVLKNPNIVDATRLRVVIEGLEKYLDDLILFYLGQISESAINTLDVNDIAIINDEENITPSFYIIENYLNILDGITEDNEASRLATLRAITAIGEVINSISLLLPEEQYKRLKVIIDIRDHIIHSSTLGAYNYVNVLVDDPTNTVLAICLTKLRDLKDFFVNLKNWFVNGKQPTDFPQVPDLHDLTTFNTGFLNARSKDDRDEQIPSAQRIALIATLPIDDVIKNPALKQLEDFTLNGASLTRDGFKDACLTLNASEAKKIHERIIELKKIIALKRAIVEHSVDFDKINLNVLKENKEQLKQIKEQKNEEKLEIFLQEHEKKIDFNPTNFINSIKEINLSPYKCLLREFSENCLGKTKKEEFDKAVKIIFRDKPDCQKLWEMSYKMATEKHINSLKRYQIIQLDHTIENIERLQHNLNPIFNGQHVNISLNPITSIACEMLYGFCLEGFKRIKKLLGSMYDYQDQTLYFFVPDHPLEKVENLLNTAILIRNDIFHFESLYSGTFTSCEFLRGLWFSFIQDLTYGTFYSNTIIVSRAGVTEQASMSNSAYQELKKLNAALKKDLPRDENFLNMYEAQVKEVVCKVRIAVDTNKIMNIIIPFSQAIRQDDRLNDKSTRSTIFLSIFSYLDIRYIDANIFLSLLNIVTEEKVITNEKVKNLVYSRSNIFFAQNAMDVSEDHLQTQALGSK